MIRVVLTLAALLSLQCSCLSAADLFKQDIEPLLARHCVDCHGQADEDPAGGFALARFEDRESVLDARRDWKKVLDAVEGFEMPPEDGEELPDEDRKKLIAWIRRALAEPEMEGLANPGKPILRRLTRLEYNNTVRDLLGLETDVFMFSERLPFDKDYFNPASGRIPARLSIGAREYGAKYPVLLPEAGLPGDTRAEHGFTNRGDAQNMSAATLDQYVQLAEQIAFHPELLTRAERLQEIFPNAEFESTPHRKSGQPKANQFVNAVGKLAPNGNVARMAEGSASTLEEFLKRLTLAFFEDRGGTYDVSQNANSIIAGKGGVLHLAYGANAVRSLAINPSEDIWNAGFSTAEETSGDVLFTNKVKGKKQFFFGFQRSGDHAFNGFSEVGVNVLSRRGQSGTVLVTAEFDGEESKTVRVELKEGAGTDNTFVSFEAPDGKSIRRIKFDGSGFSGDFVLLDDLAFITREQPSIAANIVGREKPADSGMEQPADESLQAKDRREIGIDRSIAKRAPRARLSHFLRRAFRRDVTDPEIDLYYGLYEGVRSDGGDDETAMRAAIHGVLSSPSFLYVLENGESEQSSRRIVQLTDYELANRLSYFLWSSMPDDELMKLAEQGQLGDNLEQQVLRMLKDERARELSENFYVQWLRLRELWSVQPDERKFKQFYEGPKGKRTLARDMFCEALLLFETIQTEDRSILELVDADYTFVNDRLAKLYEIEASTGSDRDWQRVSLDANAATDRVRGGVLTSAAVLTLTSFPHRTSPIRRGSWFLETIFNRPPPPPKIAVADIDEQENVENLTLRQKTEMHRANSACAVCHDRIDPPGFALENFDAIGRWRERDGDEEIDPSGVLKGIGAFEDAIQFKQRVIAEKDRFVRGFTEHLLSYALSRKLDYYDVAAVEQVVKAAAEDDYRFSRFVIEIVQCHPFQNLHRGSVQ